MGVKEFARKHERHSHNAPGKAISPKRSESQRRRGTYVLVYGFMEASARSKLCKELYIEFISFRMVKSKKWWRFFVFIPCYFIFIYFLYFEDQSPGWRRIDERARWWEWGTVGNFFHRVDAFVMVLLSSIRTTVRWIWPSLAIVIMHVPKWCLQPNMLKCFTVWQTLSNDLVFVPRPVVYRLWVSLRVALESHRLAELSADQLVLYPDHRRNCQEFEGTLIICNNGGTRGKALLPKTRSSESACAPTMKHSTVFRVRHFGNYNDGSADSL